MVVGRWSLVVAQCYIFDFVLFFVCVCKCMVGCIFLYVLFPRLVQCSRWSLVVRFSLYITFYNDL
jgi:hypothetical protein